MGLKRHPEDSNPPVAPTTFIPTSFIPTRNKSARFLLYQPAPFIPARNKSARFLSFQQNIYILIGKGGERASRLKMCCRHIDERVATLYSSRPSFSSYHYFTIQQEKYTECKPTRENGMKQSLHNGDTY